MKKPIIKIQMVYNADGSKQAIRITRGSFYLDHTTRTYRFNEMSDAQHNLNIMLSNRDKWTSFFHRMVIDAYPAWFTLMEDGKCRAAGTLEHCKHFHRPGRRIVRRMNYPNLS